MTSWLSTLLGKRGHVLPLYTLVATTVSDRMDVQTQTERPVVTPAIPFQTNADRVVDAAEKGLAVPACYISVRR